MAKREALQPGVVISVVGPTASGKTEVAIALAQKLHTEIVNADARQIYRGMSIGTAQPTAEERHAIPHHFVDFLSPNELYSAGAFEKAAVPQLTNLCSTYGSAVLAGGSGMYVKATLQGLDELPSDADLREELNAKVQDGGLPSLVAQLQKLDAKHAANMDTSNPQRVVRALEVCITSGQPFSSFHTGKAKTRPWHVVSIGLQPDREELRKRIAKRAHAMIKAGWLEETRALLPHRDTNALNTLGYKELFQHLDGSMGIEEAMELVITRTYQFAKRQMTWFQKDPNTMWFAYETNNREQKLSEAVEHAISKFGHLQGKPLLQ